MSSQIHRKKYSRSAIVFGSLGKLVGACEGVRSSNTCELLISAVLELKFSWIVQKFPCGWSKDFMIFDSCANCCGTRQVPEVDSGPTPIPLMADGLMAWERQAIWKYCFKYHLFPVDKMESNTNGHQLYLSNCTFSVTRLCQVKSGAQQSEMVPSLTITGLWKVASTTDDVEND